MFCANTFLIAALGSIIAVASAQDQGQWGANIQLPLIPMAGAVLPQSNKLLVWSAAFPDQYTTSDPTRKYTLTATIDLTTGVVSNRTVSETNHDMFCPGISLDSNGQVVVSGGSTYTPTSSFNSSSNQWSKLAEFNIPRGYHSSSVTSEGRLFVIGGSWSGGQGGKFGELYDPTINGWNTLPGCDVNQMLTNDAAGVYRSDNHANLFAWKDASVFQAAPSKTMHWFDTRGYGRTISAGLRSDATDAMCGIAVMYDTGKILVASGSTSYDNSPGTNQSYVVTLGDSYGSVATEKVSQMKIPRTLANSVVLPDGQVLVTGGQQISQIFTDIGAILTPELYNPVTKTWRLLVNDTTPRTYHSISILLPDATVFSGGGGACGNCQYNHLDGSIFKPPYLFSNGAAATRPTINTVSNTKPALGSSITVTASASNLKWSFVRMGTVTHTVNTDQRRLSVTPSSVNGNTYVLPIPSDAGVAPAGYWYLFAVSSTGVPSVAKIIQFTSSGTVSAIQNNLPDPNRPCAGATAANSFYTAPNGEIYAMCNSTNLNNNKDLSEGTNIASPQDCAALCSATANCTMATYISDYKGCYMKYAHIASSTAGPNTWTSMVKIWARPCANGASVSNITTTADGRIYGICSNTNFDGGDAYTEGGSTSIADCAARCQSHGDCISATWWPATNTCYMKQTLRTAKADTAFSSVFRMQKSPCLNHAAPSSIYTAKNGDVYGVCNEQDFYGSDLSSVAATNINTCSEVCAGTSGCVSATFIQNTNMCYMKYTLPTAVAWSGRQATFKIGIAPQSPFN